MVKKLLVLVIYVFNLSLHFSLVCCGILPNGFKYSHYYANRNEHLV